MAQHVYECMFIFDSNAYARDPGAVSGRIPKMVEKCGGELLASRLWFEQKLAFPIKGHRKGTYWLTFFRMESARVAEFDRECQLDDGIIRNLTLKVDPRMADVRISQASGVPVPSSVPSSVPSPALVSNESSEELPALDVPENLDLEADEEEVGADL